MSAEDKKKFFGHFLTSKMNTARNSESICEGSFQKCEMVLEIEAGVVCFRFSKQIIFFKIEKRNTAHGLKNQKKITPRITPSYGAAKGWPSARGGSTRGVRHVGLGLWCMVRRHGAKAWASGVSVLMVPAMHYLGCH